LGRPWRKGTMDHDEIVSVLERIAIELYQLIERLDQLRSGERPARLLTLVKTPNLATDETQSALNAELPVIDLDE